jgi:hypothetical protein
MNRSAGHRPGKFRSSFQRAEAVLGAPIAQFMGAMREKSSGRSLLGEFGPVHPFLFRRNN